ncbi:MAG TPA: NAD(P)/FAD-dependent oxidoreductase [Caproicibacter sp.]|nr:NAD(P)/FAD-dependent oxidoreductase [Caproicibacter sp.]
MYDAAIIGCGVIGAAAAYELSKYQLSAVILEKENDVACGTTKANSAIVHAGYDPVPGTKMARLNVQGSKMMEGLCKQLSVDYKQIGSLVLAFDEADMQTVRELYGRGLENGVERMQILTKEQVLRMEPNLSPDVVGALYAPTAGIVNPWGLAIALAETAVSNGVQLHRNAEVTKIAWTDGYYHLETTAGPFDAKYVVNAAGTHSGEVSDMAVKPFFRVVPVKGEYYLMDKSQGSLVNHVIFQPPKEDGKGVLISPTVHGNLIVGPTADVTDSPDDTAVTSEGLQKVMNTALRSSKQVNFRESIRNFAGVRAATEQDDFILEASAPHFINAAAIKSPGLSSAPAIALEIAGLLEQNGLALKKKEHFNGTRSHRLFRDMTPEEQQDALRRDRRYGRVICRCETITEGDILQAIHSPIPPVSIDGIKRRCNAGMGRCQGGFCGPRVHEILSRETGMSMEEVCQDRSGSYILTGKTKEPKEGNQG